MGKSNHAILCGTCKCPAETVPNPEPHDKVTCPRCHRSDRFDHVMRVFSEYVAHAASESLHHGLAKAVRGSKFVKVSGKGPRKRSFRWIADIRL